MTAGVQCRFSGGFGMIVLDGYFLAFQWEAVAFGGIYARTPRLAVLPSCGLTFPVESR